MGEVKPYQDRVIAERTELTEKVERLEEFTLRTEFYKMPPRERDLLVAQSYIMKAYIVVLTLRIAEFYE